MILYTIGKLILHLLSASFWAGYILSSTHMIILNMN